MIYSPKSFQTCINLISYVLYEKRSLAECPSSINFMYLFIKAFSKKKLKRPFYAITMNGDKKN